MVNSSLIVSHFFGVSQGLILNVIEKFNYFFLSITVKKVHRYATTFVVVLAQSIKHAQPVKIWKLGTGAVTHKKACTLKDGTGALKGQFTQFIYIKKTLSNQIQPSCACAYM